jgi:hypothetical protein
MLPGDEKTAFTESRQKTAPGVFKPSRANDARYIWLKK